jgi:hypothetical protein
MTSAGERCDQSESFDGCASGGVVSDIAAARGKPLGRRAECDRLDDVVAAVGAGHSSTLVLRGEAGIGKTVLLDYVAGQASAGAVVLRANGVESEMEMPFAGLHQLFLPILGRVSHLAV